MPDQAQLDQLADAMAFYASFEDGMDAAFARDDRRIYSAPSYEELADRGPWYWGQNVETAYDSGVSGHSLWDLPSDTGAFGVLLDVDRGRQPSGQLGNVSDDADHATSDV